VNREDPNGESLKQFKFKSLPSEDDDSDKESGVIPKIKKLKFVSTINQEDVLRICDIHVS
jgi:hypothetical protein